MNATAPLLLGQATPRFVAPIFDDIPVELRQRPNWVLWVPVWSGSKWTKRPVMPSGYAASTINRSHWSTFGAVQRRYEEAVAEGGMIVHFRSGITPQPINIGGVGFVFDDSKDENGFVFAGADFDGVVARNGTIDEFAAEHIGRLDSYTEFSVSGSGLHVIAKARSLPRGVARPGVELYTGGRFFTMTGRQVGTSGIRVAYKEFADLASELGTQAHQPTEQLFPAKPPLREISELAAGIETGHWFDGLTPEIQSQVVRHAAEHLAKHSKFFELTGNGGSYQDYLRLTLAIARSGVDDAEVIFVQTASRALNADSEEDLRGFYRSCAAATARLNGVTVGTLFHAAHQCGADFGVWKRLAEGDRGSSPE